ncbi:hypothetical protein [Paenibacillus sp. tmac-D7]|uniref:hypothetical protein n=1 Tax=Paenibacillus sp. tmac-D7 TaxID=2591462 RepID=UPI0011412580|nr:hypothetical protein [Paenibacillus sp. tmac-D7]
MFGADSTGKSDGELAQRSRRFAASGARLRADSNIDASRLDELVDKSFMKYRIGNFIGMGITSHLVKTQSVDNGRIRDAGNKG